MKTQMTVPMIVTLGLLAACARMTQLDHTAKDVSVQAVATAAPTATNRSVVPGQAPITRLIIDYTPAATRQTDAEPAFNGDALRKAVAEGLRAQGLLDLQNPAVIRVAAVEVDEFDVRATSNVMVMGRVASAAVLGATVRIRDGSSVELQQIHIRAELALRVVRNGRDKNPLEDLYRSFAGLVADTLTGKVRQSPAPAR